MNKFTKKDLAFSIITGVIAGVIAWRILAFLKIGAFFGIPFAWLIVLVPILWISGVNLGYFLGRWFGFFNQFGKFVAVGFTNATVDYGVFDLLIAFTGIAVGLYSSLFKAASFLVAMLHSYVWNKFWVFEAGESKGGGAEFSKFFIVSLVSILVNVGIYSLVVNVLGAQFGISAERWANIGAIAGSATALMANFVGLRVAVFSKK